MQTEYAPLVVRVKATTRNELAAVAKEHNRSVSAELRAAVEFWLDFHRRDLLDAWLSEEAATR